MKDDVERVQDTAFLDGGGELGALMRAHDWTATPLGPPIRWPRSLKTAVRIMLTSRQPFWLGWGPELTYLYNDAYRSIIGGKHPRALGRPFAEVWREIYDVVGPMAESVMTRDEGTYVESQLLIMERHGYPEETYYTFSYSPVPDDHGGPGGLICANTDDTRRVMGERQVATLREVGARAAEAKTVADAAAAALRALATNDRDVPFALLYLADTDAPFALAAASTGSAALAEPPWAHALDTPELAVLALGEAGTQLPRGAWQVPATRVAVVPAPHAGQGSRRAVLVAGLNPFRTLDDSYRGFLELATRQVASAVANAEAYEQERRRAEALAELDRAKTAFFSNVSHEFRTPLTLMLGPLDDALADADALPPAQRESLEIARRNCVRLLKLVNTLLDFSRIEAGRSEASYEPTDLAALTAELAGLFRAAVESAGMRFVVDCPPLHEAIYVDREMWEKIVFNLLSNAFKFTLQGEVRVALALRDDHAELVVEDTGTGIPAEELAHVFERFHRVRGARGRSFEGTGIGLALVRELVHLHGGSVRVESEVDRGTRFTIAIPRGRRHLPAERIGAARTLATTSVRADAYVEDIVHDLALVPAAARTAVGDASGSVDVPRSGRERIVLADDNADMREYVRRLLAERYDVQVVSDGVAALEAIRTGTPDLLITDAMMPRLDGFGLLRALRDDPRLRTIPVIMLSARAGEESRVVGMEAGADDYLVKPFSARELLARVAAHLGMARMRRDAAEAERDLRAEAQLAREQLENVLAGISDQFLALDRDLRYLFVNDRVCEVTGKARAAMIGRNILEVFPELHGSTFERELREAVQNGTPRHFEFNYDSHWFENHVYPYAGGVTLFVSDVTERHRAEDAVREADRRKDEFLATLAHELRNPLAPLSNALHLLKRTRQADDLTMRLHDMMERQLRHLVRLVDDLLEMARISRGAFELRREVVEVAAIVRNAVETSAPLFDAAAHRLEVAVGDERLWVDGDPVRLSQILSNILNNAARYTPPHGQVGVSVRRHGGDVAIAVRDNGRGIDADALPRVFEMFARGRATRAGNEPGLGIGLALALRLAQMHGGSIEAHSDGPGTGSEFIVRLPLTDAPPVHGDATRASLPLPSRRILVVDDNTDAADTLAMVLQQLGADVRVAHDGPAALAAFDTYAPAVVLLDIGMPGMDGYEVARSIRARDPRRTASIVALTGWGQDEDRRRAREAGFDHHLVKPPQMRVLEDLLRALDGRAPDVTAR